MTARAKPNATMRKEVDGRSGGESRVAKSKVMQRRVVTKINARDVFEIPIDERLTIMRAEKSPVYHIVSPGSRIYAMK